MGTDQSQILPAIKNIFQEMNLTKQQAQTILNHLSQSPSDPPSALEE